MDWLIWFFVGILIFYFVFLPRLKKKDQSSDNTQKKTQITPGTQSIQKGILTVKFSSKTSSSSYTLESLLAKDTQVSLLDLKGYRCPSGGYTNWAVYQVRGTNVATGRKITRRYEAKNEVEAARLAEADGLISPYEFAVLQHDDPTERQIEYLRSWDAPIPEGAAKYDVSAILSRLEDSQNIASQKHISKDYVVQRVIPAPGPTEEFAVFADEMGVKFSRYIGEMALFNNTVSALSDRDKAAFFAYCILCSRDHSQIRDPRQSEYAEKLYTFADIALQNTQLMKSINGRDPSDYLHPHKGSIAYKAVAEFFGF